MLFTRRRLVNAQLAAVEKAYAAVTPEMVTAARTQLGEGGGAFVKNLYDSMNGNRADRRRGRRALRKIAKQRPALLPLLITSLDAIALAGEQAHIQHTAAVDAAMKRFMAREASNTAAREDSAVAAEDFGADRPRDGDELVAHGADCEPTHPEVGEQAEAAS